MRDEPIGAIGGCTITYGKEGDNPSYLSPKRHRLKRGVDGWTVKQNHLTLKNRIELVIGISICIDFTSSTHTESC